VNYRHAFHAGNFADVLKHVILVRILLHLRDKEAAFRVIDTHAGAGRYDLAGKDAGLTGEWRSGIGRLLAGPLGGTAGELIGPYLDVVRAERAEGDFYPGSPRLALVLARPQDRLMFCEKHPEERAALEVAIGHDRRARIADLDGWTALRAGLPPPERRGLILIDPPYEEPQELRRFEAGLQEAHRRWASGIILFWYPIKEMMEIEAFARRVVRLGIPRILRLELTVGPVRADGPLTACGLLIVNPPWKLDEQAGHLLPALAPVFAGNAHGRHRLQWLAA
jgi:23S rRNA (adenine2030-N6)-methyltransferase